MRQPTTPALYDERQPALLRTLPYWCTWAERVTDNIERPLFTVYLVLYQGGALYGGP